MVCPITCYLHYEHACSWFKTISNLYTIPETDFHIFVRGGGVDKYLGGAAACFGLTWTNNGNRSKIVDTMGLITRDIVRFFG